jgi:hypothetical protein
MATSLTDLLQSLQQGVTALNHLTAVIQTTFPQAGALSTSATTGTATLTSSQPAAFLTVVTSSGGTYKVPLFNT